MKKTFALIFAILMLLSAGSQAFADTGINNSIIGGETPYSSSPSYSNGYSMIMATGDGNTITLPNYSSYLSTPEVMYVDSNGKHSNYAYLVPRADRSKTMPFAFHGSKVLVVAEQNGFSCIIYHDDQNRQHAAWVDSTGLESWFTGNTQTIGRPIVSYGNYYGDTEVSWSRDSFVGTRQKYTVLSSKVYDCVQFKLNYQVISRNGAKTEETWGPRTVYVNDGSGWVSVGQFQVDEVNAFEITVNLPEAMNLAAVATVASCAKPDTFIFRQSVLDIVTK